MTHVLDRELTRAGFLRLSALASLVGLVGCTPGGEHGSGAGAGSQPRRGGVLVFARNQDVVGLDPAAVGDNGSIFVLYNVVDTLVTISDDSSGVKPALATEWTVSQDGLRHTFRLRDGVKFSDGTPMTVDDVVFSLDRARAPEAAYRFLFEAVTAVRPVGTDAVEVELSEPFPPLLENLSIFAAGVVSKAAAQRDPAAFASSPVATGPFRVESFRRGDRTVLARNENYWKDGRPYLDRVEFRIVDSDDSRVLSLRSGSVQLAESVPLAQVDGVRQGAVEVQEEPIFGLSVIFLNHNVPLMADQRVRRALNLAVDRQAVHRGAYFGVGEIANSTTPKQRGWSGEVDPIAFDIAQAQALVAEAGATGTRVPLLVSGGDSVAVATAQIVEQGWRAAGLDPQIEKVDFPTLADRYTKQDYTSVLAFETADVTSPWEMPLLHYGAGSPNKGMYTSYADGELADLVRRGSRAGTTAEQEELLREVQQRGLEAAPVVPLVFLRSVTGKRTNVRGFRTTGTGWWPLEDVWLS